MDIAEIIAALVLFVIAFFSISRGASPQKALEEKLDKSQEEKAEKELEKILAIASPPSLPLKKKVFTSSRQKPQLKTRLPKELKKQASEGVLESLVHRRLGKQKGLSRIGKKMKQLSSLQDLVIYQEVIGPPKGLRNE